MSQDTKSEKIGFFARIKKFYKDLRSEAKKVVWPTPKEVVKSSGIVIVVIIIAAIFIGALDLVFSFVRDLIVGVF